jgi:hypothetical protein
MNQPEGRPDSQHTELKAVLYFELTERQINRLSNMQHLENNRHLLYFASR